MINKSYALRKFGIPSFQSQGEVIVINIAWDVEGQKDNDGEERMDGTIELRKERDDENDDVQKKEGVVGRDEIIDEKNAGLFGGEKKLNKEEKDSMVVQQNSEREAQTEKSIAENPEIQSKSNDNETELCDDNDQKKSGSFIESKEKNTEDLREDIESKQMDEVYSDEMQNTQETVDTQNTEEDEDCLVVNEVAAQPKKRKRKTSGAEGNRDNKRRSLRLNRK